MRNAGENKFIVIVQSIFLGIFTLVLLGCGENTGSAKSENIKTDKKIINQEDDYSSGARNLNCEKYAAARKECAVAGNYSQCMEIKGSNSSYVNLCTDDGKIR